MTRIIFLLALATLRVTAGDWPQFRGPGASGLGDGANPPVTWNGQTGARIAWKTPIPGLSVASPVIWGDNIYLVTAISGDASQTFRTGLYGDTDSVADSSRHIWKVLALDKNTGKILWDRTAHEGVPKTKRHPKSSQASPTPVTNGEVVVAYFGSEGLYAYSADGKLLWNKDLGKQNAGWFFDPDSEWGAASSPVIHGDSVIVQCDRLLPRSDRACPRPRNRHRQSCHTRGRSSGDDCHPLDPRRARANALVESAESGPSPIATRVHRKQPAARWPQSRRERLRQRHQPCSEVGLRQHETLLVAGL